MLGDLLTKFGLVNIVGTITQGLAMLLGVLATLGCVPGVGDFTATCNISWLPEQYVIYAVSLTGGLAFFLKLLRPGTVMRNLFGGTAVIVPKDVVDTMKSGENVVTPAQVASK